MLIKNLNIYVNEGWESKSQTECRKQTKKILFLLRSLKRSRAACLMSSCKNEMFAYFKAYYMYHIFTDNKQKLFEQENIEE